MDTVIKFLQLVLPTQGRKIVGGRRSVKGAPMIHRAVDDNDLAKVVGFGQYFDAQGMCAYVAIGGYNPVNHPVVVKDGKQTGGGPSREAEHALWHRCLRIDLDVDYPTGTPDPRKYPNKPAALTALNAFVSALKLPPPLVIDSGSGFHVYWPFDRDIELARWEPLAIRFKGAVDMHGLNTDPKSTADASRVLRIPGTHNFKPELGTARLVDLVTDTCGITDPAYFEQILPTQDQLRAADVAVAAPRLARAAAPQQAPVSGLSAGVNEYPPYHMGHVIEECHVLGDMLVKGGNGYDNAQWYMAVNAVQASMHTEQQKYNIALELSKGWTGRNGETFDQGEFDSLFNRTRKGHPFSCATMEGSGEPASSLCKGCPMRAEQLPSVGRIGTNGFVPQYKKQQAVAQVQQQVAAFVNQPAAAVPQPPVAVGVFKFHQSGRIEVVDGKFANYSIVDGRPSITKLMPPKKDGTRDSKTFPILGGSYKIKEVDRSETADDNNCTLLISAGADGDIPVFLSSKALSSDAVMSDTLSRNKIHASKQAKEFGGFMESFLQQLQSVRSATSSVTRNGWTPTNDFVLGLQTYHPNGQASLSRGTPEPRMEYYKSEGEEAAWRRGYDVILGSGADRQMLLALGIASPLMAFTGLSAVVVNMLSVSGTGKSTTADAIQSTWGSPKKLVLQRKDTENAKMKVAGITGSLPLVIDENTQLNGEDLLEQIHSLTQGRQKLRMDTNMRVQNEPDPWSLVVFSSSNRSVHGRLMDNDSEDGGLARVFEVLLSPLGHTYAQQSQNKALLLALDDNYGFLGPQLAQTYASISIADWTKFVVQKVSEWDQVFKLPGEGRFHSAVAALAEIGAMIGRKLGFAFDVDAVKAETLSQWQRQHEMIKSQSKSAFDYVNNYVAANNGFFTIYMDNNAGHRPNAIGKSCGEVHKSTKPGLPHRLVVREADLRDFVKKERGQWDSVRRELDSDRSGVLIVKKKRLFLANSNEAVITNVVCYEFNMTALAGQPFAVPAPPPTAANMQAQP